MYRAERRHMKLPSQALSFDPHPRLLLDSESKPEALFSLKQRLRAFKELGLKRAYTRV